jgi:hypothetical protein
LGCELEENQEEMEFEQVRLDCVSGRKGKQLRIWRKGYRARGNKGFPFCKCNNSNRGRSGKAQSGKIF